MDEIVPGILHWTTFHDGIGQTVHSHLHTPSGAIFDPRFSDASSVDALAHAVLPTMVLLSSRHHLRNSAAVADTYGVPIKVSEPGLWDLQDDDDPAVETFRFDDEVAEGVHALELPALAPDETVFHIDASGGGALLFGDSLMHHDGELAYVPGGLMGDDPAAVKRGLTAGLQRILDEAAPFDTLLFAHGAPIARGGRERLSAFVAAQD